MEVSRFRHLNLSSQKSVSRGVTGPLAFLTLAVEELQVPYFYTRRSMLIEAGKGASFDVRHIELNHDVYRGEKKEQGRPSQLHGLPRTTMPVHQKGQWIISKHIAPASAEEKAIYALDRKAMDASRLSDISKELRILAHEPLLRHKNIVDLIAFMWETDVDEFGRRWPILLLSDANCGTLSDFFRLDVATLSTCISLAKDVACGLNVLHSCDIVHGDLKFENVLVFEGADGEFFAQISDFGLSTVMSDVTDPEVEVIQPPGFSEPWEAPECYEDVLVRDLPKTDIYAFGLLFCRLVMQGRDLFEEYKFVSSNGEAEYDYAAIRKIKTSNLGMIRFAQKFIEKSICCNSDELSKFLAIVEKSLHLIPGHRESIDNLFAMLAPEQAPLESSGSGSEQRKSTHEVTPILPLPECITEFSQSIPKNLYEWDKRLVFAVKDDLILELEAKASPNTYMQQHEENHEAAEASYTLSSWYFSGELGIFSYEKGLEWLFKAAQYGSVKARSRVWRVHTVLGKSFPSGYKEELREWLADAVMQYEYPGEICMMTNFPEHLPQVIKELRTVYCGYGQDCFGDQWREEYPLSPSIKFMQIIQESNHDMNQCHEDVGMTWLHYAASMGDAAVVKLLLLNGGDPDVLNQYEETPLFMACQGGHYEAACSLIPLTNAKGSPSATELQHLDKFDLGVLEDIAAKLVERTSDIDSTDCLGRTSLNTILNMNGSHCMDAARILLRLGSNPLRRDDENVSPLSQAAINLSALQFNEILGFVPAEERIGAKVDALVTLMECPFHDSIARSAEDYFEDLQSILRILVDDIVCQRYREIYRLPLLHMASAVASFEIIRALISLLPSTALDEFQRSSQDWCTPLQAAVVKNRPEVVELLLQSGAAVVIPHEIEWTALFYAATWTPTLVSLLLDDVFEKLPRKEALAFTNKLDTGGASAFAIAVAGGFFDCADMLVRYGAEYQRFTIPYSGTEERYMSVLGWSCYMAPQVEYLLSLEKPAGLVIDSAGTTILHCVSGVPMDRATPEERQQLISAVFDRFSNPEYANLRDDEECTPLHYAGRFANVKAAKKLETTFGSALDLQAINAGGQTALDEAELREHHDLSGLGRLAKKEYAARTEKIIKVLRQMGVKNARLGEISDL